MDYNVYIPSRKETKDYYIVACIGLFLASYLFFGKWYICIVFSFLAFPLKNIYIKFKISSQKEKLSRDFKDVLYIVSGSIAAGRSCAEAIKDGYMQLELSEGAENNCVKELKNISLSYQNSHTSLEDSLYNFAQRSGQEEIMEFAIAFKVCVLYGGDLEDLCLKSCSLLIEKLEQKSEAKALLSEKKLDLAIMVFMPFVILLFLNLSSSDYLNPLYSSQKGLTIMAAALLTIGVALYWGINLLNVKL